MEMICSSETSIDFQKTTRLYVPEYNTLYNNRCQNLKSYNCIDYFEVLSAVVMKNSLLYSVS
jgi:hypothetical protein